MSRIRSIKPELWSDRLSEASPAKFYLYCVTEDGADDRLKIGIATNLTKRLSSIQGGNWRRLSYAWTIRLADRDQAKRAEQHVLIMLRPNPYGDITPKLSLASEWVGGSPADALEIAVKYLKDGDTEVERVA